MRNKIAVAAIIDHFYPSGDPARENNVGADRALADFTAIAAETAARRQVARQ